MNSHSEVVEFSKVQCFWLVRFVFRSRGCSHQTGLFQVSLRWHPVDAVDEKEEHEFVICLLLECY